MKKLFSLAVLCILSIVFLGTCSSGPAVSRVSANSQTDLSGYWNDTDVRIVCQSLLDSCLSSIRVAQFIQQYSAQNRGALPAVLVGSFRNDSSEHIDTSIISTVMANTIRNSGRMTFVAGGDIRDEIRDERMDQQYNASDATASRLGNETGAVLILTGSVRSIVDRAGNQTVRAYTVEAVLTNIETNEEIWGDVNMEIKKVIVQPNARW